MEHVLKNGQGVIVACALGISGVTDKNLLHPDLISQLEALYYEGAKAGFGINQTLGIVDVTDYSDAVKSANDAMSIYQSVYSAITKSLGEAYDYGFGVTGIIASCKPIAKNSERLAEITDSIMPIIQKLIDERDNAWHELCQIRVAIKANPEESTLDEVARLANQLDQLKPEISRYDDLREKLDDLLSRTAIAFRGPEPFDTKWSWHDLPYLAQQAMTTLRMCADKFRSYQQYHEAKNTDDSLEKAKVNAELVAMIEHVISCDLSKSFDATNEELAARQRRTMCECKTCGWTYREGDLAAHSCTDFLKLKVAVAIDAGIERAATFIDKRRESFDDANGTTDPDTGSLEFGTGAHAEAKREYSYELHELAECLRVLKQSDTDPVLEKPVRIGSINFMQGVKLETALDTAHRLYLDSLEAPPAAERIEKARSFITLMQGDPDKCRKALEGTLSMLKTCKVESGVCMCGYAMGMHGSEDHSACDGGAHYAEELTAEIEDLLRSAEMEKSSSEREALNEQAKALHAVGHLLELPAGTDVTTIPSILKKVGFYWVDENGKPDSGPYLHLCLPEEPHLSRCKNAGYRPVYIYALQSGGGNHG